MLETTLKYEEKNMFLTPFEYIFHLKAHVRSVLPLAFIKIDQFHLKKAFKNQFLKKNSKICFKKSRNLNDFGRF